jgi:hypothetical protein
MALLNGRAFLFLLSELSYIKEVLRIANDVSLRIFSFLRGTLFGEKGGTRLGGEKCRLKTFSGPGINHRGHI